MSAEDVSAEHELTRPLSLDLERLQPALTTLFADELGDTAADEAAELKRLQDIRTILDEFQEEPYLLDAHLETLVGPAIGKLRSYIRGQDAVPELSSFRCRCLFRYLYSVLKVRGWKAVVRLFPHEVSDLDKLLDVFERPESGLRGDETWEVRYILLLWLSLVCLLPFDLSSWDRVDRPATTAAFLLELGRRYSQVPGKERDAAAIMLGRFLVRKDVHGEALNSFVAEAQGAVHDPAGNVFKTVGFLQVLCEVVKTGTRQTLQPYLPALYQLLGLIDPRAAGAKNPLIRRFRVKLTGRLCLLFMPQMRQARRRTAQPLALTHLSRLTADGDAAGDAEFDVPAEVEALAQNLLEALEDSDGAVRYSAAKHLARLIAALPASFAQQILEAVIERFSDGTFAKKEGDMDLSGVSDSTWQGVCLALAETARKNVLPPSLLLRLLPWLIRALTLDIRKASRIVGANVRDAAAYVVWALARTCQPSELAPFVEQLAVTLVVVACFDREIHIRRAASAAFQELVGRTNLVPHGIDVLRCVDFYTCGVRRTAYLEAAVEAAKYPVYTRPLFEHVLLVSLRHYDILVRELAGQSLAKLITAREETKELRAQALQTLAGETSQRELSRLHGALLGLVEVARLPGFDGHSELLQALRKIPSAALTGFSSDMVVEAACLAFAQCPQQASLVDVKPSLLAASKKTSKASHMAAALLLQALSHHIAVDEEIKRSLAALKGHSPIGQQYAATVLGGLDYIGRCRPALTAVVNALLAFVNAKTTLNMEAKAIALQSLAGILERISSCDKPDILSAERAQQILDALWAGTADYTTDQRGDVGSLLRICCLRCLGNLAAGQNRVKAMLDRDSLVETCLKLSVERLDNVREVGLAQLQRLQEPSTVEFTAQCFALSSRDATSILQIALQHIHSWRLQMARAVLEGAIFSIARRAEDTPVGKVLLAWLQGLPASSPSSSDTALMSSQSTVALALSSIGDQHRLSNRVFVPLLETTAFLLREGAFEKLLEVEVATASQTVEKLLRGAAGVKTAARAGAMSSLLVAALQHDSLRARFASQLPVFLCHSLPKIREQTSEALFSQNICGDNAEAEELLLCTDWSSEGATEAADRLARMLAA